jgi:hypothetical protein
VRRWRLRGSTASRPARRRKPPPDAARSQILRTAIEQRIGAARADHAVTLYDRVKAALLPADRRALELPIGVATEAPPTLGWPAKPAETARRWSTASGSTMGELTASLPLVFNGDVRRFDRMRPTP